MKAYVMLLWLLALFHIASGQQNNIDNVIQELFSQQEEAVNFNEFYENLLQYSQSPLDLNTATKEDLENLNLLNPLQIRNLLQYREAAGKLLSLYELQAIKGFDVFTVKKILPFVTISNAVKQESLTQRMLQNKNHFLMFTTARKLNGGTENKSYAGDPTKLLLRYRNSKSNDFSYGFVAEKDPGEKLYFHPQDRYYLFDFTSAHFTVYSKKHIRAITLGDYNLQFGQGLVLGGGFTLGKGAETILSVKRNNAGIRPHTSALEAGFFRGSAITLRNGLFDLTAFISHSRIDGSISPSDSSFSFLTSGYHRSETELRQRKNILASDAGGNISYTSPEKKLHIGLSAVASHFNRNAGNGDRLYRLYDFSGRDNFTAGADFNYLFRNVNFFGEGAISARGGKGMVLGLIASLSQYIETSLLFRNYEKDFHSFYGKPFSESSNSSNEKGIYWGLKIKPALPIQFTFYADRFQFPWLKFAVSAPSFGSEWLGRFTYTAGKNSMLYLQVKYESKEKDYPDNTSPLLHVLPYSKYSFLFNMETSARNLSLRSRIQYSSIKKNGAHTQGYAFVEEIGYTMRKIFLSFCFSLFETDDFDNRQYVYERDVLYSFSMPFYSKNGIRYYCMARYRLSRKTDLWIRYARTHFFGRNAAEGAFSEEIPENEIKIQLRYFF